MQQQLSPYDLVAVDVGHQLDLGPGHDLVHRVHVPGTELPNVLADSNALDIRSTDRFSYTEESAVERVSVF